VLAEEKFGRHQRLASVLFMKILRRLVEESRVQIFMFQFQLSSLSEEEF
jgi:hypothetical protein